MNAWLLKMVSWRPDRWETRKTKKGRRSGRKERHEKKWSRGKVEREKRRKDKEYKSVMVSWWTITWNTTYDTDTVRNGGHRGTVLITRDFLGNTLGRLEPGFSKGVTIMGLGTCHFYRKAAPIWQSNKLQGQLRLDPGAEGAQWNASHLPWDGIY